MATLIHLDGPPGVGKSTLATRYVAEHRGVLCCDIDRLRCLVGGWQADFEGTGAIVRPVALAMIGAHLDTGHDVVLPQMLARTTERDRFRAAATDGGHGYVHVLLELPPGMAGERYAARPVGDELLAQVHRVVESQGGPVAVDRLADRLADARAAYTIGVDASGDVGATYERLLDALR